MKILHVMATCSRVSGVAQVIMSYYREIHKNVVFDYLLMWEENNSFEDEIVSYGGKVYFTGKPGLNDLFAYQKKIEAFFSEHEGEYDAVHLHELYLNPFVFPIAKRHGIRTRIAHSHTTMLSDVRSHAIRNRFLYLPINKLATHFFACSKAAGEVALGKKVLSDEKLFIVNNSIDPERFLFSRENRESAREELGAGDAFLIGHVGRFSEVKNHAFLLEIFNCVLTIRPDSKLLLIGDGKLKNSICNQARRLGILDRIIFAGSRNDVGRLLSAMDCFVLPSLFEGLGIVLVEAQCNGLCCVASDVVPAEAEILPSFTRMSLNDDPEQWAEAVCQAGERDTQSQELIIASGYDIHHEAQKLLDKYVSIIGERDEQ